MQSRQILATTSATVERINYSVTSIKKDISKSRFGIGRKQNNSESDAIAYIDDDVKADNFIGYFSSAENAVKDLEKYAPTTSMTGVFTVNSSVLGDDKEDGKTETGRDHWKSCTLILMFTSYSIFGKHC